MLSLDTVWSKLVLRTCLGKEGSGELPDGRRGRPMKTEGWKRGGAEGGGIKVRHGMVEVKIV